MRQPKNKTLAFVEHLGTKAKNGKEVDIHLIKANGGVTIVEDFKYPVWVTTKANRNHTQKKEFTKLTNVEKIMVTHKTLPQEVARHIRLGIIPEMATNKHLAKTPFLYGGNMRPSAYLVDKLLKEGYKFDAKYVAFDTETNMETMELSHISIASDDVGYVGVLKNRFPFDDIETINKEVKEQYIKYVPDGERRWNSKDRIIKVFEDVEEMLRFSFKFLEAQNPDIVGVWNLAWDVGEIERECARIGIHPSILYHSKDVPANYQHYSWHPGLAKKVTVLDDGSEKNKTFKAHEVWCELRTSASYKMIDAMGLFYQLRSQTPDIEGGFSLQNVGERILKYGKLEEGTKLKGKEKHIWLSNNKPAFYTAYAMFDPEVMIELNHKTGDVMSAVRGLGTAPWDKFGSLPYRLHNALQFFVLKRGYVAGTRSFGDPVDPILGIGKGWIVTQPAYRLDSGYTKIFGHVFDLDEVSAYPFATSALNISKGTTLGEVIEVSGVDRETQIVSNIALMISKVNSLTYGMNMMQTPSLTNFASLTKEQLDYYMNK